MAGENRKSKADHPPKPLDNITHENKTPDASRAFYFSIKSTSQAFTIYSIIFLPALKKAVITMNVLGTSLIEKVNLTRSAPHGS